MNPRTALRAAAVGAFTAGLLGFPLAAAAAAPGYGAHCADYPTRAAAQAAFDVHGGSPLVNWHGLDNDHDGFVCEHHRFPGQPTPPPNPGPGGCAVCSPPPRPSPPATPVVVVPPPPVSPPVSPPPTLPITGPADVAALAGVGGALLLVGVGLVGSLRRTRRRA